MTIDEAIERAARAICADMNLDPEKLLEWGPYVGGSLFRVHPRKEQWKCAADEMQLRPLMLAMQAVGILQFDAG